MTPPRPTLARSAALALVALLLTLAGCLGGGSSGSPGSGSGGGSSNAADSAPDSATDRAPEGELDMSAADEAGAAAEEGGSSAGASQGRQAGRAAPLQREVVSTGRLDLVTDDVARARTTVTGLVQGWGGMVSEEESSGGEGETAYTSLTVRVPAARFDTAMDRIAEVGEVEGRSRTAEDVTTQVVDVEARLRAQERSVRRVEQLLAEAEDLGDVISVESELARRQADLDSLKSQQAYLADQTTLATISVGIGRESTVDPDDDDGGGFLAGLDAGWSALVSATGALSTALGAALPFAAVLVLLGIPAWLALRAPISRWSRARSR